MWALHIMMGFIPDSVFVLFYNLLIVAGIVTYIGIKFFKNLLFKFSPLSKVYAGLIEFVGILLIVVGAFLSGGYDTEMAWRNKVKEVQAEVDQAKKESDDANTKLAKVSKQKQKVRVEYYAQVHERIKEVEKQIDAECKLDPIVPKLHNEAAANPAKKGTVTVGPIAAEVKQ